MADPTPLEVVRRRFGAVIDRDQDAGRILGVVTPEPVLAASRLLGQAVLVPCPSCPSRRVSRFGLWPANFPGDWADLTQVAGTGTGAGGAMLIESGESLCEAPRRRNWRVDLILIQLVPQ
jgi:hypothetical protein